VFEGEKAKELQEECVKEEIGAAAMIRVVDDSPNTRY
jgi:hypothetical protein